MDRARAALGWSVDKVITVIIDRAVFGKETFERVLAAAMEGCAAVFDIMQASVRERAAALLAARNGNASIESGF